MQARSCEICGERPARYVCRECSRKICETCFEPNTWFCSDCYNRLEDTAPTPKYVQSGSIFKLLLAGFSLILVGVVFVVVATILLGGTVSFGGIIFVGPIPIIFGAGPDYFLVIILALFLTVLSVVVFILLHKKV